MKYLFNCPNCGQKRYIDIPISEYDKEKGRQVCTNCNSKMNRIIEFEGSIHGGGGGWFGKSNGETTL